jgi:glycosyltransferase involved in cell wall biosynthesis
MASQKRLLAIPAFNEAATIARVIESAKPYIGEILVVDDGSSDGTAAIAKASGITVIRHETNRGKGDALKTAFIYATENRFDWLFTIDGDGQHDPHDLESFFRLLGDYDLILGNRMQNTEYFPRLRLLANRVSTRVVSTLCGPAGRGITDSQTGFRAYRVSALRAIVLTTHRYELESEILIKASRRDFRIGQCSIRTIYAGEQSHYRNLKDSLRFLVMAIRALRWT